MSLDSRKNLENTICIACGRRFINHAKERGTKFNARELMRCFFRVQASYVLDAKKSE